mmetsp:Transcript_2120/g.2192  ORF Transcript_2120/g.2192 Transcript_2120/m.2192 type:complete len:218 (-) Transcript_2120:220-873(-)
MKKLFQSFPNPEKEARFQNEQHFQALKQTRWVLATHSALIFMSLVCDSSLLPPCDTEWKILWHLNLMIIDGIMALIIRDPSRLQMFKVFIPFFFYLPFLSAFKQDPQVAFSIPSSLGFSALLFCIIILRTLRLIIPFLVLNAGFFILNAIPVARQHGGDLMVDYCILPVALTATFGSICYELESTRRETFKEKMKGEEFIQNMQSLLTAITGFAPET